MASSVSAAIDIVLGKVKALIEATEAPGAPEDCVQRYLDAYMDFDEERDTMAAAMVDLKVIRYPGVAKIRDLYAMVYGTSMGVAEIRNLYARQDNSPYLFQVQKRPWAGVRSELLRWLCKLKQALLEARAVCSAQKRPKRKRKRASEKPRTPQPLTARQVEIMQIVGECKGNIAEAARRLGRDPATIKESYKAGLTKLGKIAIHSHDKTRLLARDKRGQETVSAEDDRRR